VTDNFERIIHHNVLAIGEYSLATDHENIVNELSREFDMTVAQIVARFKYENCSRTVQSMFNTGNTTAWVPVVHIIQPRLERDRTSKDAKDMPFRSVYFESGRDDGDDKYLRDGGFRQFRALTPRWSVTSNNIYGDSPGMEALGDIKQLQHEQVRKAEGIDYQTAPPLQVPTKLKGRALDRLPRGISYYDASGPGAGVRTLFDVNLNLQHLLLDIQDVRERIKDAFYTDLFFAISNQDAGKMTAFEASARQQEQLLQLGPVLERLHNELLSPLIDMTFAVWSRRAGPTREHDPRASRGASGERAQGRIHVDPRPGAARHQHQRD